ncbi:hypothetical protein [Acidipropionibacterium timonense]|uniref:hypothetical protein n=1 Tax=Acidipropionibacterium timonense TaxID=2161818 RepID=UPI001030A7E9|nr:hypothetical protein [Acidipropionibacterium timonense]
MTGPQPELDETTCPVWVLTTRPGYPSDLQPADLAWYIDHDAALAARRQIDGARLWRRDVTCFTCTGPWTLDDDN